MKNEEKTEEEEKEKEKEKRNASRKAWNSVSVAMCQSMLLDINQQTGEKSQLEFMRLCSFLVLLCTGKARELAKDRAVFN